MRGDTQVQQVRHSTGRHASFSKYVIKEVTASESSHLTVE